VQRQALAVHCGVQTINLLLQYDVICRSHIMYSTKYLNTLAFFRILEISKRGILLSTDTSTMT
jgi:hypothetical protein